MINPKQLVHEYLKNLNPNSVLDLGCGQGKKSLRFAEKAIEIIKKIQKNTNKKGFNFLICLSNKDNCLKNKKENFYPSPSSVNLLTI